MVELLTLVLNHWENIHMLLFLVNLAKLVYLKKHCVTKMPFILLFTKLKVCKSSVVRICVLDIKYTAC